MTINRVLYVTLFAVLVGCNPFEQANMKHVKDRVQYIQAYIKDHTDKMIILVKLPGKDTLIDIKHVSFPTTGTVYSFINDSSGQVMVFGETLIRENEDWETVASYYFDKDGSTILFSNQNIFKNTPCGEKVINEIVIEYYDQTFTKISNEYSLIDSQGDSFSEKKCKLPYHSSYKVYRYSDSLMKKISFPVKSS